MVAMSLKVAALLPAYNEEHHIASVLVCLRRYVDLMIVCDDGSTDLTGDIAEAMGAIVIRHDENLGYGAAVRSLFKAALEHDVDIAVTIDADNQHDPSELVGLVEALREYDYDLVIGSRFIKGNHNEVPAWRKRGIDLINRLSTNGGVSDSQSGFRAYNRKALETFNLTEDGMGVSTEILIKAEEVGLRVGEAPISVRYLEDSSTHNPLVHGVDVALSTFKHLSLRRPLLFFGVPGLISLLVSVFMWAFTFRNYTLSKVFSTGLAVTSLTTTLVGLSLLTTGVIIWVMVSIRKDAG